MAITKTFWTLSVLRPTGSRCTSCNNQSERAGCNARSSFARAFCWRSFPSSLVAACLLFRLFSVAQSRHERHRRWCSVTCTRPLHLALSHPARNSRVLAPCFFSYHARPCVRGPVYACVQDAVVTAPALCPFCLSHADDGTEERETRRDGVAAGIESSGALLGHRKCSSASVFSLSCSPQHLCECAL